MWYNHLFLQKNKLHLSIAIAREMDYKFPYLRRKESEMKNVFQSALFAAAILLSAPALSPVASFAADAAAIELNKATADQLAATGAVDKATAEKIVALREELGGFQSFDDLGEIGISGDQMKQLQDKTSIQGISSDCNC